MRFLIILLLFCQSTFLASQSEIYNSFTLVVAQSGLNIRAEPNLHAKVITQVPYLSQLEYLSEESFGRDTIGVLKSFFREYDQESVLHATDAPLTGDWVKVKYKGKIGYTFNAYLGPVVDDPEASEYFILSPGENCGDQFFDLTKYYCYGIYGRGGNTEVREIKASYVVQETGIGFLAPLITAENNAGLKLIIGSKRELPTTSSDFIVNSLTAVWSATSDALWKDACGMLRVQKTIDSLPSGIGLSQQLTASFLLGDREQMVLEEQFVYDISIIGCGDLDGDDKVDYLIRISSEKYTRKVLYLSSAAKGREILGLVYQEVFGYCC